MSSVQEIEQAITKLFSLRNWFQEFDAEAWDGQFAADVKAGCLNQLAEDALRDLDAGRCLDQ